MELKKLAISTTSFKFRNSVHNKILTLVVGIVNYTEHSQVWLPVEVPTGGNMKFMEVLRQARLKNKISLRQLAKTSGISVASISLYELGKMEPTLRAAHTLLQALGASIEVGADSGYIPLERKERT